MSHRFMAVKINDPYCSWETEEPYMIVASEGPIFPVFLETDFTTYKGWRYFVEDFGLEGFAKLDKREDDSFPLRKELKKIRNGKSRTFAQGYMEKAYEGIRRRLIHEQETMKMFHSWFMENKQPKVKVKQHESPIPATSAIVMAIEGERISIDKEITASFRRIYDALEKAIEGISLELIMQKFPPRFFKGNKLFGQTPSANKTISADLVERKWFSPKLVFDSHITRCYLEMIEAIEDEVEIIACDNCKRLFIPSRKNEIFCSRPAPTRHTQKRSKKSKYTPTKNFADLVAYVNRKTCKEIGPQLKFKEKLKKENKTEWFAQRKRYLNRLYYLKRKGDNIEYRKAQKVYKQWENRNHH